MTEKWLTPEEDEAWIALMGLVGYLPAVLEAQLKSDWGISRFEYGVLAAVARSDGHTISMLKLSALTFGSISRISHATSRMLDRGLIEKRREGGSQMISLTDSGWTLLRESTPGHLSLARRCVFDALPDGGVAELTRVLTPILERLTSEAPHP